MNKPNNKLKKLNIIKIMSNLIVNRSKREKSIKNNFIK